MFRMHERVRCERETSLQQGMQVLFYRGVSGNYTESTLARMRYLSQTVMSTTVDLTETASPCAKNFTNVRSVTKSSRTRKGSLRITCVEKTFVGIVKNI